MRRQILTSLTILALTVYSLPALAADPEPLGGAEQQAMTDTLQHALETNRSNQSSDWVNPDTGHSGSAVPVKTFENAQGQPCREFITTITIGDREEQGYGTACRQPDGSWQLAPDTKEAGTTLQTPPTVSNIEPPVAYYAYPSGFYGPYGIFLSFDYVVRGGRLHYGHHYLDGPSFRSRYYYPTRERVYIGDDFFNRYRVRDEWKYREWERKHEWHDNKIEYKRKHKDRDRHRER